MATDRKGRDKHLAVLSEIKPSEGPLYAILCLGGFKVPSKQEIVAEFEDRCSKTFLDKNFALMLNQNIRLAEV